MRFWKAGGNLWDRRKEARLTAIEPDQTAVAADAVRPKSAYTHPAAWVAVPLAAGVLLQANLPLDVAIYSAGACLLGLVGLLLGRVRWVSVVLFGAGLFLAGLAWAQVNRNWQEADDVTRWVGEEEVLARMRLKVAEPPVRGEGAFGDKSTACRAEVLEIAAGDAWRRASGSVLLRIRGAAPELRMGHEIEAIGELSRIAPPGNPGEYDWAEHYAREGIYVRLGVRRGDVVKVIGGSEWPLAAVKRWGREALALKMKKGATGAMVQALVFGDSDDRLEEVWADFRASGTAHHLSISGMHIAVVAGCAAVAGRLMRLSPRTVLILAMVTGVGFAALARPSPPILRSVLLCVVIGVARLLGRNVGAPQCLFVVVLGMILWSPLDLLNPGLQLSFGAVAALMLWTGPIMRWILSLENEHDRMARVICRPTGLRAAWQGMRHKVLEGVVAGAVAYAITLPLVMLHFGQVNPWAIPGGVLLSPVVGMTLLLGLGKVMVCLIFPATAGVMTYPVEWSAGLMRQMVGWLARLPGAELSCASAPAWMMAVYALMLALPILPRVGKWRWAKLGPVAGVAMLMSWPIFGPLLRSTDQLAITFLAVGNGASTVVELPGGDVAMVDCGASRQSDLFGRTIRPFLRSEQIRSISHVLLTHGDMDHRLALPGIEAAFGSVVLGDLKRGQELGLGGEASWEVLDPRAGAVSKGNDASAVLRLSFAGRSVLFTGDIQEAGIGELLKYPGVGKVDVLVAPHHGSSENSTAQLLRRVDPAWIICSSGRDLSGLQKRFDMLAGGWPTVRTGRMGAIRVIITANGDLKVEHFRGGGWRRIRGAMINGGDKSQERMRRLAQH